MRGSAMTQRDAVGRQSCIVSLITAILLLTGCGPPGEQPTEWVMLNGPYAREIASLLPLRNVPGHLLVGMTDGEVYFSSNNGQSWSRTTSPAPGKMINQCIQHPDTPSVMFACTEAGLFLTRDSAHSWQRLPVTERVAQPVQCVSFDPWKPRTLIVGTLGGGIYRSSDNGVTWGPANGDNDSLLRGADVFEIRVDPDRPDRMIAALGTRGVALTENSGRHWHPLIEGRTAVSTSATHLALLRGDGATMIYATDAGSIYRTSNRGEFWSQSREARPGDRIRTLMVLPGRDRSLAVGTEQGVFVSSDFGESWRPAATSLANAGISLTAILGSPTSWYAFGTAFGLRTSTDEGRTWTAIDEHLGGATPVAVGEHPSTGDVYLATGACLLRKPAGTAQWLSVPLGFTGGKVTSFSFDRFRSSSIYATTALGALRSDDGAATWQQFTRPFSSQPTVIAAHPWFSSRLLAATARGNYYSTDQGSIWRECRDFQQIPPARSFTFRPTDAGAVYAAAGERGVLLSSDGGISWEATRYGTEQDTLQLVSLDTSDRNRCYAWTMHGRCYRSLNGGLEWNRFTPPWERSDRILLAIDPFSPSDLIALANGRTFYVTADGGTTWAKFLDCRLPGTPAALSWDHQSGRLLAATEHGGVYRINLTAALKRIDVDLTN
jgi:photosystem II stability/assembly factor-like uncharacterized protein